MLKFIKSSIGKRRSEEHGRQPGGRKLFRWAERVLMASGLALVFFCGAARVESRFASRRALEAFTQAETTVVSRTENLAGKADDTLPFPEQLESPEVDFTLWDEQRIEAYQRAIEKQSAVPLAVLRIPKLSLEVPLLDGTDDLTLNHAVGRIAGTARPGEPGNIGIAGHRDGFFRGLKDVRDGDTIELQTLRGTTTYIVDQIEIVTPHQVEVLRPTSVPSLTLVTCYPFYFFGSAPQRYVVKASLSPEKNGDPENLSAPAMNEQTRRKQMNLFKKASFMRKGAGVIVFAALALGTAAAQDSTVTTVAHGQAEFSTQVKNAEIVYVEGNDLVLKLENGRVEHLIVPDSDKFVIDGKEVGVRELVPGTKLTQTVTTMTTPRFVNSVRTIEGKVWHVNPPTSLILNLPDNTNPTFKVPDHATFTINGEQKTVFDLRKGMKIKATIVSDEEQSVVEQAKLAYGKAPQVATPQEVGVLLFVTPRQPQATLASVEEPAELLPATGSSLPFIALIGTFAIAVSVGLGFARRQGYAL